MTPCRFMYAGKRVSKREAYDIVRGGHTVYCTAHPEGLFDKSAFLSHEAIQNGTYPKAWGNAKTWAPTKAKRSAKKRCSACGR